MIFNFFSSMVGYFLLELNNKTSSLNDARRFKSSRRGDSNPLGKEV